jgi:hypothetical protein
MPGLFQRLDAMIRKVENHEALVESAVRGLEASLARVEQDHARASANSERLQTRVAEERDATESWRERAIREPVEARGVECLRRSKRAGRRAEELATRLATNVALEGHLAARSALFRERLREVHARTADLRARQTEGEETLGGEAVGPTSAADLLELFQRWEAHLRDTEVASSPAPLAFEMDDGPQHAAEEAALVVELRELKEKMR